MSAEQVPLELAVAGPASRMAAYAIDYVAVVLIGAVLVLVVLESTTLMSAFVSVLARMLPAPGEEPDVEDFQFLGMFVLLTWFGVQLCSEFLYFVFFESVQNGQTLGKRLLRLRVVGDDGGPLTLLQSVARNLMRIVDFLPSTYVTGLVSMVASRNGKRLGDWVAGTVVIRLDRPPPTLAIADEPVAGDETFVFDTAQLQSIGEPERALIRRTLRRVETIDAANAADALATATEALASRLGIPAIPPLQRAAFLRALHRAVALHS